MPKPLPEYKLTEAEKAGLTMSEYVLAADMPRLLKKMNSGKELTKAEHARIDASDILWERIFSQRDQKDFSESEIEKSRFSTFSRNPIPWQYPSVAALANDFKIGKQSIVDFRNQNAAGFLSNGTVETREFVQWLMLNNGAQDNEDIKKWELKHEKEKALTQELKRKELETKLVAVDDVLTQVQRSLQPILGYVQDVEKNLAGQCNPSDPDHAEEILRNWKNELITRWHDFLDEMEHGFTRTESEDEDEC